MALCSTLCFQYKKIEDEKIQFNTVNVPSSQYTNVMASFKSGSASLKTKPNIYNTSDQPNKGGVSIKYDSYNRYLNKRKITAMAIRNVPAPIVPERNVVNNKSNKLGVGILSEKCMC